MCSSVTFVHVSCMSEFLSGVVLYLFACLWACLVMCNWISDIVNFFLLGGRYFCISINLELCSGM